LTGVTIAIATIVLVQHMSLRPQATHASIPPQEKPALPLPNIPSIAVLPFANLGGDPQQEYFSDGIADQLINVLSRRPGLFVVARNSSFAYKGKAIKEHDIGRDLGVKYILEGSVQKSSRRIRIGVELVDASTGTELWTQRYDRPLRDIFAVQDEIVDKVVTTLRLIFKLHEMNLPQGGDSKPTDNLEAFDDFLRGIEYMWRFTKDDSVKAQQMFEKTIALDPKYAEAYSALGWIYSLDVLFEWSQNPQRDLQRSSDLAEKAVALDDSNIDALTLLSRDDWMQKRFDKAIIDAERAVALNPNYAMGYLALAHALTFAGKPEEGLRTAEKAMRLDPTSRDFYAGEVGFAYAVMGRYQEAITILRTHLVRVPNDLGAHMTLCFAYVESGREREAQGEASEVTLLNPQFRLAPPETLPFKDLALARRWDQGLREAGLK
jgi:adenylate cyclase